MTKPFPIMNFTLWYTPLENSCQYELFGDFVDTMQLAQLEKNCTQNHNGENVIFSHTGSWLKPNLSFPRKPILVIFLSLFCCPILWKLHLQHTKIFTLYWQKFPLIHTITALKGCDTCQCMITKIIKPSN